IRQPSCTGVLKQQYPQRFRQTVVRGRNTFREKVMMRRCIAKEYSSHLLKGNVQVSRGDDQQEAGGYKKKVALIKGISAGITLLIFNGCTRADYCIPCSCSSSIAIYTSASFLSGRVNRASYSSKSHVYARGSFVPQTDAQTPRTASGICPAAVKTAYVWAGIRTTASPSGILSALVTSLPIRYEYSPVQSRS